MNLLQDMMEMNNRVESFKELGEMISDKTILERIKKLKTIPSESSEFTKIVSFGDLDFLTDSTIQESLEDLLFTAEQKKDITAKDFTFALAYAYFWTYGFKDDEGVYKNTPNTANINLAVKHSESKRIKEGVEGEIFKVAKVKEEDLTEWEKELVMKQMYDAIMNPLQTSMGLLTSL